LDRENDEMENLALLSRYDGVKTLIDNEVNPLIDTWSKLSAIANNFSNAAEHFAHVDLSQTHEINELLDQANKARKLAEKVEREIERRTNMAIRAIDTGGFDLKGKSNK
jgi:hypothetical protein